MYHDFFTGRALLQLPILAMFLFALTFAAVVFWALRRGSAAEQADRAQMPLRDGGERGQGGDHE